VKRTLIAIAVTVLAGCATGTKEAATTAPPVDPDVAQARGIVKNFATALQGELQAGLQAGGPPNAISVCKDKAPAIAKSEQQKSGWTDVGRTSLKLRNPANKPDAWELAVLNKFEQRKAAGEDPMKIEHSEIVEAGGKKTFRYMKAIPTQEVCLACHGEKIDKATAAKLAKLYPKDKARGFKVGDLRGAFTLSKDL
jgi:hypothetical protein